LAGPGRGIAWRLVEGLGSAARSPLEPLLASLGPADRAHLTRLGVRFGCAWIYVPQLLKAAPIEARARLLALARAPGLLLPPPGAAVLRGPTLPDPAELAAALGYAPLPGLALRQDLAERLAAGLRARARAVGAFALPADLGAAAGLARAELLACLPALGFAAVARDGQPLWMRAPERRPAVADGRRAIRPRPDSPFAALAALGARA
jgi:ATP-dependent RNA helicase SUPV3L1/SUV3